MKKILCLFVILFWFSIEKNNAQSVLSTGFVLGFPQNEFKDNLNKTIFGFSVKSAFDLKNYPRFPLSPGLEISFNQLSKKSDEVQIETDEGVYEFTDLDVNNSVWNFNLIGRYYPFNRHNNFKPYIDFIAGGKLTNASTYYYFSYTEEDVYSDRDHLYRSWAWNYGFASGFILGSDIFALGFNIGFLNSTEAKYTNVNNLNILGANNVEYETFTSSMPIIFLEMNITFILN